MFGILAGVIVFVVIALGVLAFFETRQNESEETEQKESDNPYGKLYKYREQLVKKHGPITDRVKTDPVYAAEQFHYLIDGMTTGAVQDRVCFLLNVVEKMECMNPDLIDYMKSEVSSTEVNDYECIKQNLYDIWHGKN